MSPRNQGRSSFSCFIWTLKEAKLLVFGTAAILHVLIFPSLLSLCLADCSMHQRRSQSIVNESIWCSSILYRCASHPPMLPAAGTFFKDCPSVSLKCSSTHHSIAFKASKTWTCICNCPVECVQLLISVCGVSNSCWNSASHYRCLCTRSGFLLILIQDLCVILFGEHGLCLVTSLNWMDNFLHS